MGLRGPSLWPTAARQFFTAKQSTTLRSPQTRVTWGRYFRELQDRYPTRRVNEFTEVDLVRYLTLDHDGKPRTWSSATTMAVRSALRSFFAWATYKGRQNQDPRENPAEYLVELVPVEVQPVREHNWLDEDEIEKLLGTCDPDDPADLRDLVVLALGIYTGLRASELAAVTWDKLSLGAKGKLTLRGKNGTLAVLGIPRPLAEILTTWRMRYEQGLGHGVGNEPVICWIRKVATTPDLSDQVTTVLWGKAMSHRGVREIVRKRGLLVGINTLAPHDLRRTFANKLRDAIEDGRKDGSGKGLDILGASEMMRHKSVATTQRYFRKNPWANVDRASFLD